MVYEVKAYISDTDGERKLAVKGFVLSHELEEIKKKVEAAGGVEKLSTKRWKKIRID